MTTAIDRGLASDKQLAELNATQYVVLAIASTRSSESASELCRRIRHDSGAMTRTLDRLEEKKLVRRVRRTNDRRSTSIEVTEEGRKLFPKMAEIAMHVQNNLLRGIPISEVRRLEQLLMHMLVNAEEGSRAAREELKMT